MALFGRKKETGVRARLTPEGRQEATVLVNGGYRPDTLVVKAGLPVRLDFRREESSGCSERLVFAEYGVDTALPQGQTVSVDLRPDRPGVYPFTCGMGMLRGRLVVEP
ncbi:MAG: cupredoxin domain-containing protein [Actinomycetota bacterium]